MKKIFALLALCFVVVCGAFGEEDERQYVGSVPEWFEEPLLYAEEHFPPKPGEPEYMYIAAVSDQLAVSEKAARKDGEKAIHTAILEQVFEKMNGYTEQMFEYLNVGDEDEEIPFSHTTFSSYVNGTFSSVTFPEVEYLKYKTVYEKNSAGKKRYVCYCYARVPKESISKKLLSLNTDAAVEKALNNLKKDGYSIPSNMREKMKEMEKKIIYDTADEYYDEIDDIEE
ncbi:MAG: hypothetical protein J6Y16_06180 [Treponema sp.]|nr:hypothetical protein [Treponema sp.]